MYYFCLVTYISVLLLHTSLLHSILQCLIVLNIYKKFKGQDMKYHSCKTQHNHILYRSPTRKVIHLEKTKFHRRGERRFASFYCSMKLQHLAVPAEIKTCING